MTLGSHTEVWDMPLPGSLANGMPIPGEVEPRPGVTAFGSGVTILGSGAVAVEIIRTSGRASVQIVDRRIDLRPKSLDELYSEALGEYGRFPAPAMKSLGRRVPSRGSVVAKLHGLRSGLILTAEETALIAGVKPRRYYELAEDDKVFPDERLIDIESRATFVESLANRDWHAMRAMIRDRGDELSDLLGSSQYDRLLKSFNESQRSRRALGHAHGEPDPLEAAAAQFDEVSRVVEAPAFDVVAKLLSWIGRADDSRARAQAMLELASVYRKLDDDDQIGERWDFTYGMDAPQRLAFRERAEAFSASAWDAFVIDEADRAWTEARPVRLEPVESSIIAEQPEEAAHWQPDLAAMRDSFRPRDRRRR
jgi:hypothetical protein